MDTVSLTIDGQTVTADKGRTVLQAAIEAGIRVPYYCYHPGLGIDGSCRVCIVKIEKMPKLQTSCSTPVRRRHGGVHRRRPDVVERAPSVFEFLLINHPLDCPVCDKGGECPLQDFSYSFGPNESRMDFPRRVFDGEGVKADVDFGPTLMLNRNRCILCTRCVRFMQRSRHRRADQHRRSRLRQRNRDVPGAGRPLAALGQPDGRLPGRRDHHARLPLQVAARGTTPKRVDTICTLCEKGCNTTAWLKAKPEWAKGARLVRMTPRYNPDVNGYWMCDIGRFDYHWIEGDERLQRPLVRCEAGARSRSTGARRLRSSPSASTAAGGPSALRFLHLGARVASRSFPDRPPGRRVRSARRRRRDQLAHAREAAAAERKFTIPPVDAPNVRGARILASRSAPASASADLAAFRARRRGRPVKALYVFDPGPAGSIGDVSLDDRGAEVRHAAAARSSRAC